MANPFASKVKETSKAKFKSLTGKKSDGQKFDGGKQVVKKATGGAVEASVPGKASGGRLDKFARGGRAKGTNVNIAIVVPGGKSGEPPALGVPPLLPPGAGPGGGPGPMIAGPANPPGPPIMPPGGGSSKPVLRKYGGAVKMTGGAEGGLGRLQKAKAAAKGG